MLDERIRTRLAAESQKLLNHGALLAKEKLSACYVLFKEKFGPRKLAALDGEPLLEFMHGRDSKDSLVYWLEFKNDDEFPAKFGSISGGSALKFGIFRRKETGAWMTGHPQNMQELSTEEAVTFARNQRDQLVDA